MIIIIVRTKTDWLNYTIKDLKYKRSLIPYVKKWNSSGLNMSYFQFRHELKNIAVRSWISCSDVIVHNHEYNLKLSDEDIIIPVDDDDWFSPEISKLKIDNYDFIQWKESRLSAHQCMYFHPVHRTHYRCGTNNFAFNQKVYKLLKGKVFSHSSASRFSRDKNLEELGLKKLSLKDSLSTTLKHIASAFYTMSKVKQSPRDIKDVIVENINNFDNIEVFDWAKPYFEDVKTLYKKLIV
jgi:hypothetical protein